MDFDDECPDEDVLMLAGGDHKLNWQDLQHQYYSAGGEEDDRISSNDCEDSDEQDELEQFRLLQM